MSTSKGLRLILVAALSLLAVVLPATASADNSIALSPFLQSITVTESDTTKTFPLVITNNSPSVQQIDLSARDFGSLNSTGGVLLKGSNDSYSKQYGLASWLTLEADTVVLSPGESRSVEVSINNRQDLQPGGHYGAVVASVKSLDDHSGNKVAINQQLLSLLLITKQGGAHYDLALSATEQNGNWLHLPTKVTLHFRNPGNVHVTPRGLVLLKNPASTVIASGVINTDSAYILPASLRDVYVYLKPVGHHLPLPGVYRVDVQYRYDGVEVVSSKHYAVHFISLKLYLLMAMAGLVIWRLVRQRKSSRKNQANTTAKTE